MQANVESTAAMSTSRPHSAQLKVLHSPVKVFDVVKASYILTASPCFNNLELTFLMQVVFSATLSHLLPLQLGSKLNLVC